MSKIVKTGQVIIDYEIHEDLDNWGYRYDWRTANGESDMYFKTIEEAEKDVRGIDHE